LKTHFFAHKKEEIGYVIEGQLQVTVNNQVHVLSRGDLVYLAADMPSQWKNVGTDTARLFWLTIK
jgi:quercetin dioxygenase-like cupin family protein